jgi:hypothetical protein
MMYFVASRMATRCRTKPTGTSYRENGYRES